MILHYLIEIQLFENLELEGTKNSNIFDIFTVGNLQKIFMEHDLYLIS